MHFSRVVIAISCILLQIFPEVLCAEDLDTADYVAIAVSLGLTALILAALLFFLWRARKRSEMGTNETRGQSNAAVTGDNEGDVRGIRMSKISGIERM